MSSTIRGIAESLIKANKIEKVNSIFDKAIVAANIIKDLFYRTQELKSIAESLAKIGRSENANFVFNCILY